MKTSECTKIFSEVLSLNRQLLLLQIQKIEDEIIPVAEILRQLSDTKTISSDKRRLSSIISNTSRKIAILNSLKHELCRTEMLTSSSVD